MRSLNIPTPENSTLSEAKDMKIEKRCKENLKYSYQLQHQQKFKQSSGESKSITEMVPQILAHVLSLNAGWKGWKSQ